MTASPSYGDRQFLQGGRRTFTPIARSLSLHERAGLDDADATAEILYTHPDARIVFFSPLKEYIHSNSTEKLPVDTDYPVDTIETLPWRTRVERLLAAGTMKVEKVRGSTVFLKCDPVSQAFMRNTQCWCVDGESKFVIRIRPFEYYRVELPSHSDEDKRKIGELKAVLKVALRFERTPCPFKREFTVDLPEDAITPRRKGTWKRRDSSQPGLSDSETQSPRSLQNGTRPSMRSPPSSFPKNGPNYGSPLSATSPGSPAGFDVTPNLTGHIFQQPPADENKFTDPDIDHEHARRTGLSEITANDVQRHEGERGRPIMPRQASATVPVSVRIASIERSKQSKIDLSMTERKPLSPETPTTKDRMIQFSPSPDAGDDLGIPATQGKRLVLHNKSSADSVTRASAADTEIEDNLQRPVEPRLQQVKPPISYTITNEVEKSNASDNANTPSASREKPESPDLEPHHVPNEENSTISDAQQISTMTSPSSTNESNTPLEAADITGSPATEKVDSLQTKFDAQDSLIDADGGIEAGHTQTPDSDLLRTPRLYDLEIEDSANTNSDDDGRLLLQEDVVVSAATDTEHAGSSNHEHPITMIAVTTAKEEDDDDDAISVISSADSFHTLSSNIRRTESEVDTELDQTPINQSLNPFSRPGWPHRREISELTVTGSSASHNLVTSEADTRGTDSQGRYLDAHNSSSATTAIPPVNPELNLGLRQRLRARRSFSPMPPSSIIINNPPDPLRIANNARNRELAKAVLQTVIVKPIEIAVFMLHIISRIAQGATTSDLLSGELFRRPEHRRRVSGFADQINGTGRNRRRENYDESRNDSYSDHNGDNESNDTDATRLNDDHLDDFDMPIRGRSMRKVSTTQHSSATQPSSRHGDIYVQRDDDAESFVSID